MKQITLLKIMLASSIALGALMTVAGCHVHHDDYRDHGDHPAVRHDDHHDDHHNDNQDNHYDDHQ